MRWTTGTALVLILAATVVSGCGENERKAPTVQFQSAEDAGPDPFVATPADRPGSANVKITPSASGVAGGAGSNRVCDRDAFIRLLQARPDRVAPWALVRNLRPTSEAVVAYIARLHPVTLTRDTRATTHSLRSGRVVTTEAILAAGTALLVDDFGNPVARCRSGSPLLEPAYLPRATCDNCPPGYDVPAPTGCPYSKVTFQERWYPKRSYSNATYDEVFIRRFRNPCYTAYPDPPLVASTRVYTATAG